MTKLVKGRVTGTFNDVVELWLDEDEFEEMDEDDLAEAIRDAWSYTEFEDLEVDEDSIEVRDLPPIRRPSDEHPSWLGIEPPIRQPVQKEAE
jgi:hypothetical protein